MDNNPRNNLKKCEICQSYANNLCYQCISYYCESCYKFVHEKEINSNHKKEPIDPFVPMHTKCPSHPKVPFNLFCADEKGKILLFLIIIIL